MNILFVMSLRLLESEMNELDALLVAKSHDD